jgi:hypothetical protein
MSFDYASLATTADTIIANFGVPVTVVSKGTASYNVNTGAVVATDTTQTANGVITEYNAKDIDNTMILRGDKCLLLSPIGITSIKPDAKVIVAGVSYNVISVNETNPAGVALVYDLQIRGV